VDLGVSGAYASRASFDRALAALDKGDTLVVTTLDRLRRSAIDMLGFAVQIRDRGAGLHMATYSHP
jgi:DNA invertase Pin-like site-specific DNA recombinase